MASPRPIEAYEIRDRVVCKVFDTGEEGDPGYWVAATVIGNGAPLGLGEAPGPLVVMYDKDHRHDTHPKFNTNYPFGTYSKPELVQLSNGGDDAN